MGPERADDGLQLSIVQFSTPRRGPWFGLRAGGTKDRLSGSVQSFFGMVSVENLDGLRKQFRGGVPDPGRTIPQCRASGRLGEASPRGFSQHTLGEVGSVVAALAYRVKGVRSRPSRPPRLGAKPVPRSGLVHWVFGEGRSGPASVYSRIAKTQRDGERHSDSVSRGDPRGA